MIQLVRTNSDNTDFQLLVSQLDALLRMLDGDEHAFYAALNTTDSIKHVIVAYSNEEAAACGALRAYSDDAVEVKRMFTVPSYRGKGIASTILSELEIWAKDLGFKKCILETGHKQPEAINLYTKSGYKTIPNYGKYKNVSNSICFEKLI